MEPFAGSNNLIKMLQKIGFCNDFKSFDLMTFEPQNEDVKKLYTLSNFPQGITNPLYLAHNSATRIIRLNKILSQNCFAMQINNLNEFLKNLK